MTSAEGLVLACDFNLDKLFCNINIKNEIENNPDPYFRNPPTDEEKMEGHHTR